jgi:hypothetical protein
MAAKHIAVKRYELRYNDIQGHWIVCDDTQQNITRQIFENKDEAARYGLQRCQDDDVEFLVYDEQGNIEWAVILNGIDGSQEMLLPQSAGTSLPGHIARYMGAVPPIEFHGKIAPGLHE